MSFLDELKENTRSDDIVNELLRQREELWESIINKCVAWCYHKIKDSIMESAKKGDFQDADGKKLIEGEIAAVGIEKLPSSKQNNLFRENGIEPIGDFYPKAIIKSTEMITETRTKKAFLCFNRKYKVSRYIYTFAFTDDTVVFLKKLNELAKADNVELTGVTIWWNSKLSDDFHPCPIYLDDVFSSDINTYTYEKIYDFDTMELTYSTHLRDSLVGIKYRVLY